MTEPSRDLGATQPPRRTSTEYVKQWRVRNPVQERKHRLLMNALERAKKLRLPFNLRIKNIVWPTVCPVLGIPINYANVGRHPHDDSPSVDRLDLSKGYVLENVAIISFRANRLKNDSQSGNELRLVAAYIDAKVGRC